MRAAEIRALAVRAGIGPGVSVLDLCCGVAGPGRLHHRGARVHATSAWTPAPARSRSRASAPPACRAGSRSPGSRRSLRARSTWCCCWRRCSPSRTSSRCCARSRRRCRSGGRFAFTVEEGAAADGGGAAAMPDADTVWLVPLPRPARPAGAGRAPGRLGGGVQRSPPGDGRRAGRRVRRRPVRDRRRGRRPGARRAAGRAPALERLAAGGAGPQVRGRRREDRCTDRTTQATSVPWPAPVSRGASAPPGRRASAPAPTRSPRASRRSRPRSASSCRRPTASCRPARGRPSRVRTNSV